MSEEDSESKERLAITIEGQFNQSRRVVFQTTVPLKAGPKEIYKEFSMICEVMDRREEYYLLKGLKITHERETAEISKQIDKVAQMENHALRNWALSNRKGPMVLSGQEKHNIENQLGSIEVGKERLKKIESEIRELEELQKASA